MPLREHFLSSEVFAISSITVMGLRNSALHKVCNIIANTYFEIKNNEVLDEIR